MSDRDSLEVEALASDAYIDALLAARDRRDRARVTSEGVDAGVDVAAGALERHLARVHPSFRFEERLAADLQAAAARARRGRPTRTAAIRRLDDGVGAARRAAHGAGAAHGVTRAELAATGPGRPAPAVRPLLIGGALTSAALSIAGAYVAWRRGRPPLDPMVRAVRAAHRSGLARRLPAGAARLAPARGGRR